MGADRYRAGVPLLIAIVLALNGLVNVAAGLSRLFHVALEVNVGLPAVPAYLRVAPRQHVSAVVSVVLGFLLLGLAKGLHEQRRRSWAIALVVLIGLVTDNVYSWTAPQTAVASAALVVALVVFREYFRRHSESSLSYSQLMALASVLLALAYGVIGSHVLRNEFEGLRTWTDAVYFTFETYSTVGYGDIVPTSPTAKAFVISMIPIGLASFITALSALLGPLIEARLSGVLSIMKRLEHVREHVVVCGYTNVSESAVAELTKRAVPFVIVDGREYVGLMLRGKGYDVILGDPAHGETLEGANVLEARAVLAATDSDATNILIAITAKGMPAKRKGPPLRIIVRVEREENIAKALAAGADDVISPSTEAGRAMAARAVETAPSSH